MLSRLINSYNWVASGVKRGPSHIWSTLLRSQVDLSVFLRRYIRYISLQLPRFI